ncbi:MAG: glycosyltransferase family 2 protein [Clostridia bacterium]|nr:glycosyltransferase family 2 protein [Clostridia bacterium]
MIKTEPVEILMATYNGSLFLREQMDSILNQTDGNWHLTVSDDGSDDGTQDIIADYARRFPEKITWHQAGKRFGNARDHFFHLMKQCSAAWMLCCDQDDTWYPNKVEKTRDAIRTAERQYGSGQPLLVFSDQVPTDAQLCPLAPSLMRYQKQYFKSFDFRSILMQNVVTGGAMGINRALVELAGQCADVSQIIMHDWWMAAVAARFGKIIYIDEPLGTYRQHGNNAEGAKHVGSLSYAYGRIRKLQGVRDAIRNKKRQAAVFQKTYQADLTPDDAAFLAGFGKKRSGFSFYWKYRKLLYGKVRKAGMALLG